MHALAGKFGMLEMEKAAKIIADKGRGVELSLRDFPDEQMKNGFLHLLAGGWMECTEYNGMFRPTKAFWDRIK